MPDDTKLGHLVDMRRIIAITLLSFIIVKNEFYQIIKQFMFDLLVKIIKHHLFDITTILLTHVKIGDIPTPYNL